MNVLVKGAGVAGLATALELQRRGAQVTVFDPQKRVGGSASWYAGGMLAPWCEGECADKRVTELGIAATGWWNNVLPGHVECNGTLVVAPARDHAELNRFASRTTGFRAVDAKEIGALEPALSDRFRRGLFFENEAHLEPRLAMQALQVCLARTGCSFRLGRTVADQTGFDAVVDCTGIASPVAGLRGVRGEMLLLRIADLPLKRPVRLLHPRIPVYVVPRGENLFMIGATMIESADHGGATVRSVLELLNAAYALHPAFADAEIVEIGAGIRPAFSDNLPRVSRHRGTISLNGLYRHGFLLAPVLAARAAAMALETRDAANG